MDSNCPYCGSSNTEIHARIYVNATIKDGEIEPSNYWREWNSIKHAIKNASHYDLSGVCLDCHKDLLFDNVDGFMKEEE